jgi:small subunit ribosomal protein S14
MAKKSLIEREKKRVYLVNKYSLIIQSLKEKIRNASNFEQKLAYYLKIQSLPRNSFPSRLL